MKKLSIASIKLALAGIAMMGVCLLYTSDAADE